MSNFKRTLDKEAPSSKTLKRKRNSNGAIIDQYYEEREIIEANKADGVEIYSDEQHLFHVLLVNKVNNPVTKEYDRKEVIQSFNTIDFNQMKEDKLFDQYDEVHVLHDPTKARTKKATEIKTADTQANSAEAEKAAKELNKLRVDYAKLWGEQAPDAATFDQLRDLIDQKKFELAQAKKKEADDAKERKPLLKEYEKLYGVEADENASNSDLQELIAAKKAQGTQGGASFDNPPM